MFKMCGAVLLTTLALLGAPAQAASLALQDPAQASGDARVRYRTAKVNGVDIFYREAGPVDAPAILLLHGFPTSSQMFRELIPRLASRYRVIAPDYPGFGYSQAPDRSAFDYTFENYARVIDDLTNQIGLDTYALYVMDYGAPVGFRLAVANPDKITAIVVQNGNAYDEGFGEFWDPIRAYWRTGGVDEREGIRWLTSLRATHWQYTNGVRDTTLVSPDAWTVDQALLDRPGNQEIQLDLLYDYRTNLPLYPEWQAYFRQRRPPTLVVWGANDAIFFAPGAEPYRRDNPDTEVHMIDTGHFALETHGPEMASLITDFLDRKVARD